MRNEQRTSTDARANQTPLDAGFCHAFIRSTKFRASILTGCARLIVASEHSRCKLAVREPSGRRAADPTTTRYLPWSERRQRRSRLLPLDNPVRNSRAPDTRGKQPAIARIHRPTADQPARPNLPSPVLRSFRKESLQDRLRIRRTGAPAVRTAPQRPEESAADTAQAYRAAYIRIPNIRDQHRRSAAVPAAGPSKVVHGPCAPSRSARGGAA